MEMTCKGLDAICHGDVVGVKDEDRCNIMMALRYSGALGDYYIYPVAHFTWPTRRIATIVSS